MEIKIDATKVPASMGGDDDKTPEQIEQERIAAEQEAARIAAEEAAKDKGGSSDDNNDEPDQVEIDGVVYSINETGDAINDKGEVVFTADKLKEFEEADDDTDTVSLNAIKQRVNVILTDEAGKEVEYEDSVEGIARYVSDVVAHRAKELNDGAIQRFFERNPEIHKAYLYKEQNGNLEGFKDTISWKDFDLSTATPDHYKAIITNHRKRLGDDETAIGYLIGKLEADKTLETYGKNLVLDYVKEEEKQAALVAKRVEEDEKRVKEENTAYWNKVKSVITSGNVVVDDKTVIIPEVLRVKDNGVIKNYTRDDFYKYVYELKQYDIDGTKYALTQYQYEQVLRDKNRNENHDVLEALKMFLKDDTSQVIERAIKDEHAKRIRRLNSSINNKGTKGSRDTSGTAKIVITRD